MNEVPFLGDIGYVPAPRSSGWSLITILIGVLTLLASGYAVYYFFFRPLKSNDLELEKKKVDPIKVMVDRELEK